jgi:hypothetical protein
MRITPGEIKAVEEAGDRERLSLTPEEKRMVERARAVAMRREAEAERRREQERLHNTSPWCRGCLKPRGGAGYPSHLTVSTEGFGGLGPFDEPSMTTEAHFEFCSECLPKVLDAVEKLFKPLPKPPPRHWLKGARR